MRLTTAQKETILTSPKTNEQVAAELGLHISKVRQYRYDTDKRKKKKIKPTCPITGFEL